MSKEETIQELRLNIKNVFQTMFQLSNYDNKQYEEKLDYLTDKISQALDQTREEIIRECEGMLPSIRTALYATGEFPATEETKLSVRYQEGLNEGEKRYRDKIKQLLINLRK